MLHNIPATRGLHNVNSSVASCKSPINNRQGIDFLKLHMLEKERIRLLNEEKKILFRLEFVQNRQKDIQLYVEEKTGQVQSHNQVIKKQQGDKVAPNFKFMSIDY